MTIELDWAEAPDAVSSDASPHPATELLDCYLIAAGERDVARRRGLIARAMCCLPPGSADEPARSRSAALAALRRALAAEIGPVAGAAPVPMTAPLEMPQRPFRRLLPLPGRLLQWSTADRPRLGPPAPASGT